MQFSVEIPAKKIYPMLLTSDHSLDQAFTEIHDQLKRAGVDTRHKFRFFSVATVTNDKKTVPQSRMVVLRSFSDDWTFEFFTDHRSTKVEEIKKHPMISALFWDPSKRVQVRIEAEAKLHNQDKVADNRWKKVQGDAQKAYTSIAKPGAPVGDPADAHKWPETLSPEHFCAIKCSALGIKVLQISGMEHFAFECRRQALHKPWEKTWIAP
jgi:general stress protein 26